MDIKKKLFGKKKDINPGKEEQEFPEEFTESPETKKAEKEAEGIEINEFIRNKKELKAEKEVRKEKRSEAVEEEPELPVEQPTSLSEQPKKSERTSNLENVLTVYVEKDKIEETKQTLDEAIAGGYVVAMQAGIQVTRENAEKVKSVLKYFAENGYLVVISGQRVEPVFDEPTK